MPDTVPVVLVVDIDPETHLATDGALPETECVLVTARSAEMGLKMATRRPPSVLVVDGKIGGLTYLTEKLRRLSPHLHVILLVGADQPADAPAPRISSPTSLLRKPFDVMRFRSTVRTVMRLSAMSAGVKLMHGAGHRAPLGPAPTSHGSGIQPAIGHGTTERGSEPPPHVSSVSKLGHK
ncbi:Hypothetical protein A7982_07645 [Minicystis rosea]|nr:Hypothetical protein A7982_07645 [Minicystis rosea]